jgi:hypothetical protein
MARWLKIASRVAAQSEPRQRQFATEYDKPFFTRESLMKREGAATRVGASAEQ